MIDTSRTAVQTMWTQLLRGDITLDIFHQTLKQMHDKLMLDDEEYRDELEWLIENKHRAGSWRVLK